jgi:hypothetical protein
MGHWANRKDFKEAVRRRNLAHVRARLRIGLVIGEDHAPGKLVWDALAHLHESRGIRELHVDEDSPVWPDLAEWAGWYRVLVVTTTSWRMLQLGVDGLVVIDSQRWADHARAGGYPVWEPSAARQRVGAWAARCSRLGVPKETRHAQDPR